MSTAETSSPLPITVDDLLRAAPQLYPESLHTDPAIRALHESALRTQEKAALLARNKKVAESQEIKSVEDVVTKIERRYNPFALKLMCAATFAHLHASGDGENKLASYASNNPEVASQIEMLATTAEKISQASEKGINLANQASNYANEIAQRAFSSLPAPVQDGALFIANKIGGLGQYLSHQAIEAQQALIAAGLTTSHLSAAAMTGAAVLSIYGTAKVLKANHMAQRLAKDEHSDYASLAWLKRAHERSVENWRIAKLERLEASQKGQPMPTLPQAVRAKVVEEFQKLKESVRNPQVRKELLDRAGNTVLDKVYSSKISQGAQAIIVASAAANFSQYENPVMFWTALAVPSMLFASKAVASVQIGAIKRAEDINDRSNAHLLLSAVEFAKQCANLIGMKARPLLDAFCASTGHGRHSTIAGHQPEILSGEPPIRRSSELTSPLEPRPLRPV